MKLAFYKNDQKSGIFSQFVRFWDRSQYSHVEIIFESSEWTNSDIISAHEQYSSKPLQEILPALEEVGIFACASSRCFKGVFFSLKFFDKTQWHIVDVPKSFDAREAVEWFQNHYGEGYDYWGLLGFLIRRIGGSKKRWFCSEAVAAALQFPQSYRFTPSILACIFSSKN